MLLLMLLMLLLLLLLLLLGHAGTNGVLTLGTV